MLPICPHGDPTCPCPDGDSCHYEGLDAWPCPNLPPLAPCEHLAGSETCSTCAGVGGCPAMRADRQHCHVEGCRWESEGCGLGKLIQGRPDRQAWLHGEVPVRIPVDSPEWACGAARATACLVNDGVLG